MITQLQVWNFNKLMLTNGSIKYLSLRKKLPKEKHITYLKAFFHLMKFSCIIFHLFSHVLQVLSHTTHCSGNTIYAFGRILDWLVQSTNHLTLLINNPNDTTNIDIPFFRTLTKFWNVNRQIIFSLEPEMTSSWHLGKVSIEIFVSARTEIFLWWKGWWVGYLYLQDGPFPIIPRH